MSVKRLTTLATVMLMSMCISSAVLANTTNDAVTPSYSGLYLEGNVGYTNRAWKDTSTFGPALSAAGVKSSNSTGGFAAGVDLGYQINQNFAVEGGWYYLPQLKMTTQVLKSTEEVTIDSGLFYGALKIQAPVYENTAIFGKVGIAYTYNSASGKSTGKEKFPGVPTGKDGKVSKNSNFLTPLVAVGVQYDFTPEWDVNAQYTFVPGYSSITSANRFTGVPNTHLFTVGIGYKFLI